MHITNYLPQIILITFVLGAILFWPVMTLINKYAGPVLKGKGRFLSATRIEENIPILSALPDTESPGTYLAPPVEVEHVSYEIEIESLESGVKFKTSVPEEVYYEIPDEVEITWRKELLTGKDFGYRIAS